VLSILAGRVTEDAFVDVRMPTLGQPVKRSFLPLLISQAVNLQQSGAQEFQIALAASHEVAALQ
jgi:hypothetical protein